MWLTGFSIFSSHSHFVKESRTILAFLLKVYTRVIAVKLLKSGHQPKSRCNLNVFFFSIFSPQAISFSEVEPF